MYVDIYLNTKHFKLKKARSLWEKVRGLSFTKKINNDGMIFFFNKLSRPLFWNFGMYFPIDVIWVKDKTIVDISTNIPPMKNGFKIFYPSVQVDCAIEMMAHEVVHNNISIGDKIKDITFLY